MTNHKQSLIMWFGLPSRTSGTALHAAKATVLSGIRSGKSEMAKFLGCAICSGLLMECGIVADQ